MTSTTEQIQDTFLSTLQREKTPVSVFLVNGIKLQGQIESFDRWIVLLRSTGVHVVYKHAIATVVPTTFGAQNDRPSTPHTHTHTSHHERPQNTTLVIEKKVRRRIIPE